MSTPQTPVAPAAPKPPVTTTTTPTPVAAPKPATTTATPPPAAPKPPTPIPVPPKPPVQTSQPLYQQQLAQLATLAQLTEEQEEKPSKEPMNPKLKLALIIVGSIMGAVGAFLALYLSWTCNTSLGYGGFMKVMYGIGAFLMNWVYVSYFVWFRMDICRHCGHSHMMGGKGRRKH